MCRLAYGVWCPCWGFGAFPALCWGWRIVGRGSSVELPFYDVRRHVEKVGREDHGYAELVAVPQEGQQVGGSGLGHHR